MNEVDAELVLGKMLQEARQNAGFTQQELCHKADISYSTLAKIERGAIKAPSVFTIERIATVLNTSIDALLNRQTTPSLPPIKPKKVAKNGVRFIYFDVNGCLVRFFHRSFTNLSEKSHVPADIIESTFWRYNDAVCSGNMSVDELNQNLAKALNIEKVDWQEEYMSVIEPVDEMNKLLAWVAEEFHVGLLTNIFPGFINELIERKLIPDVEYSAIIDSSEVGFVKPDKEIYEIAEARSNCQPEEIMLVDDSRSNITAASRCGWKVLWFDDHYPSESIKRIQDSLDSNEA